MSIFSGQQLLYVPSASKFWLCIDLVQAEVFPILLLYQLKIKLQFLLNTGISFAACWFRANGYDGGVSRRSL